MRRASTGMGLSLAALVVRDMLTAQTACASLRTAAERPAPPEVSDEREAPE